MLCSHTWTRPSRRIVPCNGRLIGSAPLSFSGVLNARSRERGLSCRARRTGCFPTRPGFKKSFTKADSVGFGINFASREADWSTLKGGGPQVFRACASNQGGLLPRLQSRDRPKRLPRPSAYCDAEPRQLTEETLRYFAEKAVCPRRMALPRFVSAPFGCQ